MARHNKPIWISAGISAALLIAFFFVQSWDSDILGLPVQYLLLALVPLVIGLLMSGYIREVKAGGVGLTVADEALKSSTPIPDSGQLQAEAHMVSGGWQVGRATEYKRTRGYMLAHVYKTSNERGQLFDISIFVVRHKKGAPTSPQRHFDEISKVEFFFGDSWGNQVFPATGENGFFGVRTHAWGTFLAMCRISFREPQQEPVILFRYVDFFMADATQEIS